MDGVLARERARRRQRVLDALRVAAEGSEPARRLLELIDPDGTLSFETGITPAEDGFTEL